MTLNKTWSSGSAVSATEQRAGILTLNLPDGCELFVTRGLPQVLERVAPTFDRRFDRSWLYLPPGVLESVQRDPRSLTAEIWVGDPIEVEEFRLIPIVRQGRLSSVIVKPQSDSFQPNADQLLAIQGAVNARLEVAPDSQAVTEEFIGELFHRESSADSFYKRLLSLAVTYWPRAAASIYMESPESYRLRMVVGDVTRCHFFPSHLRPELSASIQTALQRGETMVPAEMLPDLPTFLSAPPEFYFVHPAMKCERSQHLLIVVGSGDIDRSTVLSLERLGLLTSCLHESQFATATDFLDLYAHATDRGLGLGSMESALREAHQILSRQISISRTYLHRLGAAGEIISSWEATGDRTGRIEIKENPEILVPVAIREKMNKSGEPVHVTDLNDGAYSVAEAKKKYLQSGVSIYFMPVKTRKGVVGYLEINSSIAGNYLSRFGHLFDAAAGYFGTLVALEELADQRIVPSDDPSQSLDHLTATRLAAMRKLIDGFLHGLSSRVSVVVGQCELLTETTFDTTIRSGSGRAGLEKISTAADELATRITSLREVVDLIEASPDATVDASAFLADLPSIFEGFGRKIKDTRNVELPITFATASRQAYRLRAEDALDVIVPVLMTIMEHAICSGSIALQGSAKGSVPVVTLQFRKSLLGYTPLESLFAELFPDAETPTDNQADGLIKIGERSLAFRLLNEETYHVAITCRPSPAGMTSINSPNAGKI